MRCVDRVPHHDFIISDVLERLMLCTCEEVRLEREKLGSKEARLAGLEAALEATRREMDRQAAEVAAAMQVGGQC